MRFKSVSLLCLAMILSNGCAANQPSQDSPSTPEFLTATLSSIQTPELKESVSTPDVEIPTSIPIDGTTTTQVNVRSEPSTVGDSLGIIAAFSKIQILGKESNGVWYQILYSNSSDGKGWVAATYVQVDAAAQIPLVQTEADSGSGMSGLVIQGINVRTGPATSYESLGTLSPNDIVKVTGKDSSNAWLQVEYKGQVGWASAEFLKVKDINALPVTVNSTEVSVTPTSAVPSASITSAIQDGDSMQAPAAVVTLANAFQFTGNVSSPTGDSEDWLQFKSFTSTIIINVACPNDGLLVQLLNQDQPVEGETFSCGQTEKLEIKTGETYYLHIQAKPSDILQMTQYRLKLSNQN